MPLGSEFKHHLRELFAEVVEDMAETEAKYKAELVSRALSSHNRAQLPIAYSSAELHRIEVRFTESLTRYLEALKTWNIKITDEIEREMTHEIEMLTAGANVFSVPPGVHHNEQLQAVQAAFARERKSLSSQLIRKGKNRLREMKAAQANERTTGVNVTIFQANGNNNSQIQGNGNAVQQNAKHSFAQALMGAFHQQVLVEIDEASQGHADLEAKAAEVRHSPDEKSRLEKVQQWLAVAGSVEGIAEKVHSHLPSLLSFLRQHRMSL